MTLQKNSSNTTTTRKRKFQEPSENQTTNNNRQQMQQIQTEFQILQSLIPGIANQDEISEVGFYKNLKSRCGSKIG